MPGMNGLAHRLLPGKGYDKIARRCMDACKDAQVDGNNFQTIKEVNREFARAKIAAIGFPI